jgi:glycosyltransferase involved in cell wall biosynthesis
MVNISVIVPVYKVEIYIEKCIYSLLAQTFDDFEIILVDDCSPDQSIELAKKILENQSQIPYQIISKDKNEGLSAARNTAIENSNGKYLLFVDSDDWIEKETLQKLFETAISTEAGMVVFRIRQVYNDGVTEPKVIKSSKPGVMTGKEALLKLLVDEFEAHICKILFSKTLFDTTQFPVGVVYEDMLTLPYLLIKEEKVCFIDDILYNYLQRVGSITRSYDPDIVKVCNKLYIMEKDLKPLLDKNQKKLLVWHIYMSYLVLCHHASTLSPNYKKAKELLLASRKNIKSIELLKLLQDRTLRSMFQLFLLKASPYNFFKKYNLRFRRLNNTLNPPIEAIS